MGEFLNPSYAATITVAGGSVAISNDALCSLREAIVNANDNANTHSDCTAVGTYGADEIELSNVTFTLADGPFAADGDNGLPSITDSLTINAHGAVIERDAMAATDFRIFRVAGTGVSFTLNDATVRNGRATSAANLFASRGGGMLDKSASTLNNCTFTNNYATDGGAIAYAQSGTAAINDSTISGNTAASSGGAIFNGEPHTLNISGTTISGNTAVDSGGGAISNYSVVNTTCTLMSNNSALYGGALADNTTGTASIFRSTISGNHAVGLTAFTGDGGGIYHGGSNLLATGTKGLYVIDSTISGNDARSDGGGIFNGWGNTFLFSSTIAGNRADSDDLNGGTGGGVANYGDSFTAGMTVFTQPARLDLSNTILADNSDGGNGANDCVDFQTSPPLTTMLNSQGFNLIEDTTGCAITQAANPGTDVTGQDPGLPALTFEPGACTPTQCPTAGPAINVGPPSTQSCPGGPNSVLTVDQRGLARPVDGACDAGACEFRTAAPPGPPVAAVPVASGVGVVLLCALLSGIGAYSLRGVRPGNE